MAHTLDTIKIGDVFENTASNGFVTQTIFLGKKSIPVVDLLLVNKQAPAATMFDTMDEEEFKSRLDDDFYTFIGPKVPSKILNSIRLPDQKKGLKNIESATPVKLKNDVRSNIISFLRKSEKGKKPKFYGGRRKTRKYRKKSRKTTN